MSKTTKFLISGWYGYKNIGDEIILSAIISSLKKEFQCEVYALSNNPKFTNEFNKCKAARHLPFGLKAWIISVLKLRFFITLYYFVKCDALLIGGGGFLSDWQIEAPWIWLRQAILGKLLKKKVMLYGIGAGPIRTKLGKKMTSFIINNCIDAVTVRDKTSYEELINSGVNAEKVHVTEDPVYSLNFERSNSSALKRIGISAAPIYTNESLWPNAKEKYSNYIRAMRNLIVELSSNYECVFIPMQNTDIKVYDDIRSNGLLDNFSIVDISSDLNHGVCALSQIDLLIGMRLHAGILAALQNTLVLPIVYHHKVYEFAKKIGVDSEVLEIGDGSNWKNSNIDVEKALKRVTKLKLTLLSEKDIMYQHIESIKIRESKNCEVLRGILHK
ncbi:polysaccharide pyruvyl transferase family protein [Catenovulum sp. 2E275]|uniref:polysaccharide pyruvyl transferase family protein n=1 Tax=Catenovulum sp. 2E275 TaxID=2980497 RepID=UPI0021D231F1|nr:polysaccharide pyruvyl transferase family protein [Catenovulum sp. 2E275]MCU4677332.1 polysaccharide pyruvyl transferase family protein [Catenovulum sp. 2E275]